MVNNIETSQVVDSNSLDDALMNVIERWGFELEVEHQM
jgi:hypothetical protein